MSTRFSLPRFEWAALATVAGVALQLRQAALWPVWVYAGLMTAALCALAIWTWRARQQALSTAPSPWNLLAVVALALAVGFAWAGLRAVAIDAQALNPAIEGRDVRVVAIIDAMPQRSSIGWRTRLKVEQATVQTESAGAVPADWTPIPLPERVQVSWYAPPPMPLRAGDRWALTLRLRAPHGAVNPHGFDSELWWWEQGIRATGYVRTGKGDAPPRWLAATWQAPIERARQQVRDAILQRLGAATALDDRAVASRWDNIAPVRDTASPEAAAARRAGVIAALVTGDQAAIERSDWELFRVTGVAHLMSISGLHITLFAWLASRAVGALWRRSARWVGLRPTWQLALRWPAPWVGALVGWMLATAYALFSGWGVPAQRTVWMLGVVTVLRISGLHWPWTRVLLCAALAVCVVDPWALLQAGFWLSFVAVAVLFASDPRGAHEPSHTGSRAKIAIKKIAIFAFPLKALWRGSVSLLREQGLITLALAPLGLLLFGQISIVGLVANLIAIPWVTFGVLPPAMLGAVWPPLWSLADAVLQPLMGLLMWMAQWSWGVWWRPTAPIALSLLAVAGGVLMALNGPWRWRALGLPMLLPVLLWQPLRPAAGQFEVLGVDVGQGTAVLVRTAQHSLLYDAGPRYSVDSDAGQRILLPLLRARGERLDVLLLSHRDSDHTGGAAAILAAHPQAALLASHMDANIEALRTPLPCVQGQHWAWDGVLFEVLHPLAYAVPQARKTNAMSCVLRVSSGRGAERRSLLLTGDIERAQEEALVARSEEGALQADVLVAPHHGSKTSSSATFLAAVRPRWVWIQSGYRNRFGHPVQDVLGRYRAVDAQVLASPHCGAMQWHSAVPDRTVCVRDQVLRYWHHRAPALDFPPADEADTE